MRKKGKTEAEGSPAVTMSEKMSFNIDIELKALLSLYLMGVSRRESRDEFFRNAIQEYLQRHSPELYAKRRELAELFGK